MPLVLIIIGAYDYGQGALVSRPPLLLLEKKLPQTKGKIKTLGYLKVKKILNSSTFMAKIYGRPTLFVLPHHGLN
ncbi:MAG: hypothetical protein D6785_12005, partial [Planctomycetota bacterium]